MKNNKFLWKIREPKTPFERALYIWDIRAGSVLARARNWRLCALLVLALCCVLAAVSFKLMSVPKVIPYIIEVSETGKVLNYGRINKYENYELDSGVVRYYVVRFLQNIIEVDNNVPVEKRKWNEAYAYVTMKGGEELTKIFNERKPLEQAEKVRSEVEVNSYIDRSASTKEIWFTETVYDLQGNVTGVRRYKGVIQVVLVQDASSREKNPLGIYIDTIVLGEL